MNAPAERAGGCLCAAVRYRITTAEVRDLFACHCTQCRKTSGHFVVATACATAHLDLSDPDGALTWYASSPDAERGFCRVCGSSLFWRHRHGDTTSIMAGSLDNADGLRIREHIYTNDAGGYYDLNDGLPCYAGSSAN